MSAAPQPTPEPRDFRAAAELHHRFLTGLILALVLRAGEATGAEAVYRLFRRQHREKFLPGLRLLGLAGLPDAVASAQYHYLSNFIGTVKVELMAESDRKAWIRYPPPRWIFDGVAICGIPDSVTIAMMRGWHAHNGEALGNPRLGFACTGMTTAGDPGLEGYFFEADAPLAPEERLRFAPDERAPAFDPAEAPKVDAADWPEERLAKAERNYAMDFVRGMLAELAGLLGEARMVEIAGRAARQIGMQYYDATRALLGLSGQGPAAFANTSAAWRVRWATGPSCATTGVRSSSSRRVCDCWKDWTGRRRRSSRHGTGYGKAQPRCTTGGFTSRPKRGRTGATACGVGGSADAVRTATSGGSTPGSARTSRSRRSYRFPGASRT